MKSFSMNTLLTALRRVVLAAVGAAGTLAAGDHAGWATVPDAQAAFAMREVALLGGPAAEGDVPLITEARIVEPGKVAGFDLTSDASVRYRLGDVTFLVPRKLIGINFASMPTHTPPKIYSPELALLYPGFGPIPPGGETKYRLLAPEWSPDLIVVWINIPDEPERVANFNRPIDPVDLLPGPYGLYKRDRNLDFFVARPDADKILMFCNEGPPAIPQPDVKLLAYCDVQKYMFENIPVWYKFHKNSLPDWQAIDDGVTKLINSFVRGN